MKVKVKITYKPEQAPEAAAALAALRRMFPTARVHETDRNAPTKALYLTVTNPANPHQHTENG